MNKKIWLIISAIVVSVVLLGSMITGCKEKPAGPVTLKFAAFAAQAHWWTESHDWLFNELEKRTNGQVKVERYYAGSLVQAADSIDACRRGTVDVTQCSPGYTPAYFSVALADTLPFQTSDGFAAHYVVNELHQKSPWVDEWTALNLKSLGAQCGDTFLWTTKPVQKLEDIKGMKIRTYGLQAEALKALGAVPVALAMPEAYESLQRGVIDGATLTIGDGYSTKCYEVCKYITAVGLGSIGYCPFVMNMDVYKGLPSNIRKVVDELADEYVQNCVDNILWAYYERIVPACREAGCTLSVLPPEEMERWRQIGGPPVWEKWINEKPELADARRTALEEHQKLLRQWEKKLADWPHPFEL